MDQAWLGLNRCQVGLVVGCYGHPWDRSAARIVWYSGAPVVGFNNNLVGALAAATGIRNPILVAFFKNMLGIWIGGGSSV